MNIYLQICWEYIINILEAGLFYYYIRTFLTPKKIPNQDSFHIVGVIIRFLIISICNTLKLIPIYSIIICGIYNVLFTCTLFKEKNTLCIFWSAFHNLLCIISEFTVMVFLQIFANIVPSDILFGESHRFPVTTLYIIILAAFSFYIPTLPPKNTLFKGSQKIFIVFFMSLGIIITHCFMYLMPQLEQTYPELLDIIVLANIIFLCFFIALLFYIYQLALTQKENEDLQARTRLLELETAQYNNLLSTTESLRVIKHDIHHHLSTIQSLIQNGESERLVQYLKEYQTHFDLDYTAVATGNIVIDSIISTKLYFAKQQNTHLDYRVVLPNRFPFTDVALSALLGNLFDNALEACQTLPPKQTRWILFQVKVQENMLLIHMENSFDGFVKKTTTHGFLTRKTESDHGVGLNRVNTLVEETGGFMDIRYNKQTFIVHIMMPLEDTYEI